MDDSRVSYDMIQVVTIDSNYTVYRLYNVVIVYWFYN